MYRNRLFLFKFYLVGNMDHSKGLGKEWRVEATEVFNKRSIICFDPYNKPINNLEFIEDDDCWEKRQKAKKNEDWETVSKIMKGVRNPDLRMTDISDAVVCNLDLDKRPCGSWEEIGWANRSKKPVMVRIKQGKNQAPDWLFAMLPHQHIFSEMEEIYEYVRHIDEDEFVDTYNRWVFFDWKKLLREQLGDIY